LTIKETQVAQTTDIRTAGKIRRTVVLSRHLHTCRAYLTWGGLKDDK
jgi:hypothetical protein